MTVEVLYFDGCPGCVELLPRLRRLVAEDQIELVPVTTPAVAQAAHFLGSPTVRVNGTDVEPGATGRVDYGLKCRLYATPEGFNHAPTDEQIRVALRGGGEVSKH